MKYYFVPLLLISSLSVFSRESSFIDKAHENFSNSIVEAASSIDNFFVSEGSSQNYNRSQLRIFSKTIKAEAEEPSTKIFHDFRLILPKTEKKLQIVVTTDEQIHDSNLKVRTTNVNSSSNVNGDNSTKAGLRYILEKSGVQLATTVGMKAQIPPALFINTRAQKQITVSNEWTFTPTQNIKWIDRDKIVTYTGFNFDNSLSPDWLLRMVNSIEWNDKDYIITLTNGPSLLQRIDESKAISYNSQLISQEDNFLEVINYRFFISYRQLLYSRWFYWQLSPIIEFPRDNKFHQTPSFEIKFEARIGGF